MLKEFLELLPQLLVTFFGVFLAFMLDRGIEWAKNRRAKNDLLRDLHTELEESRDKASGQANLHFPDIWKSAISSGQIRLLDSEQVRKLAKVYRGIQAAEYEAKWVRQAKEDLLTGEGHLKTRLERRWKFYSEGQVNRERILRQEIVEVLKEKWWP